MTDRPLISMVMIAKDEARNIEPCFSSFWDHVDQVVLVDTGSTDSTIATARAFATRRKQRAKLVIGHYKWHDDFAAARNYANTLATGEWIVWCDLDDALHGAENLRLIVENTPAECFALMADYIYATDERGNSICTLKRERLIRNGHSRWEGRVHEAQQIDGPVQMIPGDRLVWRHRKKPGDTPTDRNLKILEAWAHDEPDNGRVVQYLGTERAGIGQHAAAVEAYKHYLTLPDEPDDHRAQVYRKLACSLIALEQPDKAFQAGVRAHAENPLWPDSYLTLAQTAHMRGEHEHAVEWAREVLRRGVPDTLLIINPQDYTVEPRVVLAGSLAALGNLDEACAVAEEALRVRPDHPLLAGGYREWRVQLKRKHVVETWLGCVQTLCAHDEQAKALELLESTVPYFATDDPRIVQVRSELRERLAFAYQPGLYAEHYRLGGSKPEDMIADENVTELCEALPRVQFLKRHIEEMLEAA